MKTNWIRDLIKTCKIDFFQIQEHFKRTKTIESYFKKEFPTSDSFVVPAYREPFQDSGRAKGGLAQLSNKGLDIRKERLATNNWRLQAQILHINDYRIIWFNCYFPTDPQTIQFEDEELSTVLENIENLLDTNSYDDCILGGDFNFDARRTSGFATVMKAFISRIGIVSIWDKYQVDYTHTHTDQRSHSVLDHFFVNQELLDKIVDAGPVHLGDNLSRHSTIMMKMELDQRVISSRNKQGSKIMQRRPAWYKASKEEKNAYTANLDTKLRELVVPDSLDCRDVNCSCVQHSDERDKHIIDILCATIETSYSCIPLSSPKPSQTKNEIHCLPGWKEIVAPLKQDSLFWHSIWKDAGSPQSGGLHQVMCQARRSYHNAVKQVKRKAGQLKAEKLITAADTGDIELLKELKNTLSKTSAPQLVPDSLDGKVTPNEVIERFRECYEELFNSASTVDAMAGIKAELMQLIDANSASEVEKVTGRHVVG